MAAARSRFDPLEPERSGPRPDQPAGDVVKGAGRQLADPDSDEPVDLASATAARQVYEHDDILSVVPRPIKRVAEDDTDVAPTVAARVDASSPYLAVSGRVPERQMDEGLDGADDSGHKDWTLGIDEVDSALTNNEVVEGPFKSAVPVDQHSEPGLSLIDDPGVIPGRVDPIMEKIEWVYDKIAAVEIDDDFAEASSTAFDVDVSDEFTEVLMDDDGVGFDG